MNTLARVEPNSLQLHMLTKPVCDYMHSTTAYSDLEVCEKAVLFMVHNFNDMICQWLTEKSPLCFNALLD